MGALYAVGWRARGGGPRRWQWGDFESLEQAVQAARGHVRFDGGGRWRVYETRLAIDGTARQVLGRILAEGVEPQPERRNPHQSKQGHSPEWPAGASRTVRPRQSPEGPKRSGGPAKAG